MLNHNWYPIDPSLTNKGAFHALSQEKNAGRLKPIPLDKNDQAFAQIRVLQNSLSMDTAQSLGVAVASIQSNFRAFCLTYEVMMFSDKVSTKPVGGKIYGTRWGAGLRVMLKVANVDINAEAKLTFGAIAASAQLGMASVEYEINVIGINDPKIVSLLPGPGEFNFESYSKILDAADEVKKYMSKKDAKLEAKPFQVFLTDDFKRDVFKDSQSVIFACRQVMNKTNLLNALKKADSRYNKEIIKSTYKKFGINDQTERPNKDKRVKAEHFLNAD